MANLFIIKDPSKRRKHIANGPFHAPFIDSVVNYMLGKKHGEYIVYDYDYGNFPAVINNYRDDSLNGVSYYFSGNCYLDRSVTFKNNTEIDRHTYKHNRYFEGVFIKLKDSLNNYYNSDSLPKRLLNKDCKLKLELWGRSFKEVKKGTESSWEEQEFCVDDEVVINNYIALWDGPGYCMEVYEATNNILHAFKKYKNATTINLLHINATDKFGIQ